VYDILTRCKLSAAKWSTNVWAALALFLHCTKVTYWLEALVILCSISKLRMFSVDHLFAIINPPQEEYTTLTLDQRRS
jgi:hypothetical protein